VFPYQFAILLGSFATIVEIDGAATCFRPGVDTHVTFTEGIYDCQTLRFELFPLMVYDLGIREGNGLL